ncbi:M20 family metallopeptidase [Halobacillus sp. Marseille-Q1614]|uniref:M20 metallopeptidase family protein n=1 Tax=Halobacillus sp. Marseille-Q1614 TaxID=2709134 RepID=UPI00156FABDF|nr:amidohydrolase [Halobacillus sp. Marseille-Q1614]
MEKAAGSLLSQLIAWRRHFHKYPELSFQEKLTSEKVAEVLRGFKVFDIQTGVGGYGVVATLSLGEGPVIGFRADMDALPIGEQASHEYVSRTSGIMHACGHDAHTAILLGTAKVLAESYQSGGLKGTIKLIFQPAEESCDSSGETGAVKMLNSGSLDDIDAVIALHMCPWRKRGTIQIHDGPSMANNDEFELMIRGSGGHGGYPHETKDPIWMSSFVLQALYSLNGRKVDPLMVSAVSIGQIQGGEANNVIPDAVTIKGTLRSYVESVRKQLVREVEQAAAIVKALGGEYDLHIQKGEPALNNDPSLNQVIRRAAKGFQQVEEPFGMGSEDFSYMTNRLNGSMFFLGCGLNEGYGLHHPKFNLDEAAMEDGVHILLKSAEILLSNEGGGL